MKNVTRIFSLFLVLCAVLGLAGCATTAKQASSATSAAKNAAADVDLHTFTLSNGIPVYILQNDSSRVQSLSILVKGGAASQPSMYAGLEQATMSMISRGSNNYNFDTLQYLAYQYSCSMGYDSDRLYSTYSMNCIDYYLDDLLPVYLDCFMNPAMEEEQFELVMTDMATALQQRMNDPWSLMQYRSVQTMYAGTSLDTDVGLTEESMNFVTLDAVKENYEKIMNADRLAIVAVGNFDETTLVASFEQAMGAIPAKGFTQVTVNPLSVPAGIPEVLIETHPSSNGTAFMAELFVTPTADSPEYMNYAIASSAFSEILFNVVRENYGDCYSIGMGNMGLSKAPVGLMYVYRASDYENIYADIQEAKAMFAAGKVISDKDENGEYIMVPLAERLEGYTNALVNSSFENQVTNAGVASKIIGGIVNFNDPLYYTTILSKIRAVTEEGVIDAFNKYYVNGDTFWYIVTGPDDEPAFAGFGL